MSENSRSQIQATVRGYILNEFLPGESPSDLTDATPLRSSGILDSIATARLVSFLEEHFGVHLKPHEISSDRFDTIVNIVALIDAKVNQ